jgi:hypothetical protein
VPHISAPPGNDTHFFQMGLLVKTFVEKRKYTKNLASVGRKVSSKEPSLEKPSDDYDVIIIGGGMKLYLPHCISPRAVRHRHCRMCSGSTAFGGSIDSCLGSRGRWQVSFCAISISWSSLYKTVAFQTFLLESQMHTDYFFTAVKIITFIRNLRNMRITVHDTGHEVFLPFLIHTTFD